MKILFEYPVPFAIPHKGSQERILHLREALLKLGVEVEYLRWFDDRQTGQILHYFGSIRPELIRLARQKGLKVVMSNDLGATTPNPRPGQIIEQWCMRLLDGALKKRMFGILPWHTYQMVDACVASSDSDARMMSYLYNTPIGKIHTIPDGLDAITIGNSSGKRTWQETAEEFKKLYAELLDDTNQQG
jgi:hypothetical protein